jgi:hypothetical protein
LVRGGGQYRGFWGAHDLWGKGKHAWGPGGPKGTEHQQATSLVRLLRRQLERELGSYLLDLLSSSS